MEAQAGDTLGNHIYGSNNSVLLKKGTKLTDIVINLLRKKEFLLFEIDLRQSMNTTIIKSLS